MTTTARSAGRPALVAYEDVAQVCADLDSRGLCTIENVHRQLGGMGSRTTVHKHYQAWRNQLRAAAAQPFNATFSEGLRLALAREIETATANARAELESRVRDLEEQLQSALGNLQEAEERVVTLEGEVASQQDTAAAATREHGEALAAMEARAVAAEKQVVELQERVVSEQRNAETSRVAAAEARIKADAAAEGVRTLGDENRAMRAELKELQKSTATAEQRAAVAEERAQNRDEQLTEMRQALDALRERHREQEERLLASDKARHEAERELAVCKSERLALEGAQRKDRREATEAIEPHTKRPKDKTP